MTRLFWMFDHEFFVGVHFFIAFLVSLSFNYKSTFCFTNLDIFKLLVSSLHIFVWFLATLIPFFSFQFFSGGLMVVNVFGGWFRAKEIIAFVLMLSCL